MKWWGKKDSSVFDYSVIGADMHSHLLPGIDDGAPDFDTSLKLIKGLSNLGFKKLVTTPHIMWDMYKNRREEIIIACEKLREHVNSKGIDIKLKAAAEYFLDDHVKQLLANKEPLLTVHDNMVLVEFSMASEPIDLKEILFEMQMQGYQPVIAHPERYLYHERNKDFFEDLKISGYYFQLNIMSLAGTYGKAPHDMARYFIKNQYYELAGTDLHNENHLSQLQNSSITQGMKELLESGKLLNQQLLQ